MLIRTVKAGVVIEDAERLLRWDTTQLDEREKADARNAFSTAMQTVWDEWWWSELMECAQTQFAATAAEVSGDYVIGFHQYWPLTDSYYYSMNPALPSVTDPGPPTDFDGETNDGWIKWEANRTVEDYDNGKAYVIGDLVRFLNVNWACRVAGTANVPFDLSDYWVVLPDWTPTIPYTHYSTNALVGPFGRVRSVSKFDPREKCNPQEFEIDESGLGTRVLGLTIGRPWVWSRRVTPVITGDAFDATALYTATATKELSCL